MSPSKVAPTLHRERVTAPGADPGSHLVFLHGIFGAGRNWATVARHLVRERPEWGALLVDLREHGSSQGFPPPHTLAAVAADVGRLVLASEHPVRGVLGHSFGGKVALELVRGGVGVAAALLETLWVVDSTPEARAPGGSAWSVLAALKSVPGPFQHRAAGVAALQTLGVSEPVARWMATNLEEGNRWVAVAHRSRRHGGHAPRFLPRRPLVGGGGSARESSGSYGEGGRVVGPGPRGLPPRGRGRTAHRPCAPPPHCGWPLGQRRQSGCAARAPTRKASLDPERAARL